MLETAEVKNLQEEVRRDPLTKLLNKLEIQRETDAFLEGAEDGIRDDLVTGVQTCALPIYAAEERETQGVWKTVAGVVLVGVGVACIAQAGATITTYYCRNQVLLIIVVVQTAYV